MAYAQHIGRIGALAFALGVGIGLGATPATALAEEASGSTSSSSDSSPGSTAGEPAATSPEVTGTKKPSTTTDGRDEATAAADTATSTVRETVSQKRAKHRLDRSTRAATPRTRVTRDADAGDDTETRTAPRHSVAAEPSSPAESTPPPATPRSEPAIQTVTTPVAPAPEPAQPVHTAASHVTLRTVLSSLLGRDGSPDSPAAAPALWVLAAAARRQLGAEESGTTTRASATTTALDPGTIGATPVVAAPDAAGVVTGSVGVTGADPATVTYTAAAPGTGTVLLNPGPAGFSFTYTPTKAARHAAAVLGADASATTDTVVFTISDATGATTVPVVVTILPADAPPTARATASLPSRTGEVRGRVIARDADGDTLTYVASSSAKGGTVTLDASGRFVYTPTDAARHAAAAAGATDADRTDTFDVVVSDGHGGLTTVSIAVRVKPGNDAPMATVHTHYSPLRPVVTGTVRARDREGDALTYTAAASAKGGTVTVDARGRFVYTPTDAARHAAAAVDAPRRDTVDTFDITVIDGHGGSTTVAVTVRVKPADAAPTGASTTGLFTNPNTGVVTGTVTATDADGDPLTYGIVRGTRKGDLTIDEVSGAFVYTPTANARAAAAGPFASARSKTDMFTVSVDDGHGGTTLLTVRVGIAPLGGANQAPTDGTFVTSAPGVFTGKVTGVVSATDPNRDVLTYSGSGDTAKGSVVVNADGSFTYTPSDAARHQAASTTATAADKQDTFTVTAADGYGGTLGIAVTVAVSPSTNKAPTKGISTSTIDTATGVVTGTASATDAEADTLVYSGTTTTDKGGVTVATDGAFTYTPTEAARLAAGVAGAPRRDQQDSFVVTVDDGHGGVLRLPVQVTIVGLAPVTTTL